MRFEPKTDKEIRDSEVWQCGEYDFEISQAEERTSANDNDMFVLRVILDNGIGLSLAVTDYVLPHRARKFFDCCVACDLLDKYYVGDLAAKDFVGKTGRCRIRVEKGTDGYPDKNVIAAYLAA